jgi:hypothetical protein
VHSRACTASDRSEVPQNTRWQRYGDYIEPRLGRTDLGITFMFVPRDGGNALTASHVRDAFVARDTMRSVRAISDGITYTYDDNVCWKNARGAHASAACDRSLPRPLSPHATDCSLLLPDVSQAVMPERRRRLTMITSASTMRDRARGQRDSCLQRSGCMSRSITCTVLLLR